MKLFRSKLRRYKPMPLFPGLPEALRWHLILRKERVRYGQPEGRRKPRSQRMSKLKLHHLTGSRR